MADFLSLLTAIPSLMSDFSGSTSDPYAKQKKQLADQMGQISAAQGDVNNPLYKQLYGQYQDQNRQNLAQTVAELQGQNRQAIGNGRTPLFDPSRGGEQVFRALMQGQQTGSAQSAQQTQQALSSRLGGFNSTGNFLSQITPGAAKANAQGLQGYQTISDMMRGSQAPQQPQSPYNPGPIAWNQPGQSYNPGQIDWRDNSNYGPMMPSNGGFGGY